MDYKSILSQIDDFEHQCLLSSQPGKSPHKKIRNFIKDKYTQMWVHYHQKGFANQEEEIFFFKHVKPAMVSKIFFYNSIKEIDKGFEKVPEEHKNTYYQSIYDIILQEKKTLIKQWEHFEYYKSGRTDLDSLYYTLNKGISIYSVTYSGEIELLKNNSTDFSTLLELNATCHLLFKETLKHLRGKLLSIPKSQNQPQPNAIQWTHSKAALTELIYAIYIAGAVDKKHTSIKELSERLSEVFNIPLPNIHHTFFRMKNRKSSQTTPFLDLLKKELDEHIQKNNQ